MHSVSPQSYYCLASSSIVNIEAPAFYWIIMSHLPVYQTEKHSRQLSAAKSDSQSINTSLLEVMISSKNEWVIIRDLTNLTLQIIFDTSWASMNVGLKHPIARKHSRHAPSWHFNLHCGIEETGSPGIICIICHQVLRHPSEHRTSSMGKYMLTNAHIAKLNKLTESEVSEMTSTTIDETA